MIEENFWFICMNSILAGIYSGFGLGGGVIIVTTLGMIGLNSLSLTATSSLCIFVVSFMNCVQGISIGVIPRSEFAFYVIFLGISTFFMSAVMAR